MLFFYMIVLFLIFVIQFSVACACLAVDEEQEINYASQVGITLVPISNYCLRLSIVGSIFVSLIFSATE